MNTNYTDAFAAFIQNRTAETFSDVLMAAQPYIKGICRSIGHHREADDIFQDMCLKLLERFQGRLDDIQPIADKFMGYMRNCVKSLIIDKGRWISRRPTETGFIMNPDGAYVREPAAPAFASDIPTLAAAAELGSMIDAVAAALPEPHRTVLALRPVDTESAPGSNAVISKHFGHISASAAAKYVFRAKAALIEALAEHGIDSSYALTR